MTYDQVADKARSRGFTLSKAALHGFVTQELAEAPRRRTMEAIGCALDVSYTEVVLAVTESLIGGPPVEVTNQQHVHSWLTLVGGRSDEEVASVLRVVRTVTTALDAAHEAAPEGARQVTRSDDGTPPVAPPE